MMHKLSSSITLVLLVFLTFLAFKTATQVTYATNAKQADVQGVTQATKKADPKNPQTANQAATQTTSQTNSDEPISKVLVISADHSSMARVNLLNKLNKDKAILFKHIKVDSFIGKGDQEDGSLQQLAADYDLLLFSAINEKFARSKFVRFLSPSNKSTKKKKTTFKLL